MKMPLRYHILNLLNKTSGGMTPKALFEKLSPLYAGEKQCTELAIDHHLMSMKGVGLVEIKDAILDKDDKLEITYAMTQYGRDRAKRYIGEYLV